MLALLRPHLRGAFHPPGAWRRTSGPAFAYSWGFVDGLGGKPGRGGSSIPPGAWKGGGNVKRSMVVIGAGLGLLVALAAIAAWVLVPAAHAGAAPAVGAPAYASIFTSAALVTDTEVIVLRQVAQELSCPPEIQVDGAAYILTCVVAMGHSTTVRVQRFPGALEARAAFDSARGDRPLQYFHCYPSCSWQYDESPTGLVMRHRIQSWLVQRWLVHIEAFDDTGYLIAPAPPHVSELVYQAATERELFPPQPCLGIWLPCVLRQHAQPTPVPTPTLPPDSPAPPLQIVPPNGAALDTISPSFTLDNSLLGQRAWAQLQYSPAPDFSSGVDGFRFARFQGTSTAPLDCNLSPATTYHWRVRSSLDGVTWGPWSGVWFFTTPAGGTLPGTPALLSPANGGTVSSLRSALTWSPVSGATRYAVTVGGSTFFSSTSEYTLGVNLDPATVYTWSVSARNTYGWGNESSEWTFTTPDLGPSAAGEPGAGGGFFERCGSMSIWQGVSH